jgi:hypothetical protein
MSVLLAMLVMLWSMRSGTAETNGTSTQQPAAASNEFITDLHPHYGVIQRRMKDKCFPTHFLIIHGKFSFSALQQKWMEEFHEIETAVGHYWSTIDTENMKQRYKCSAERRVNDTCPTSSLEQITDPIVNGLRHQLESRLFMFHTQLGSLQKKIPIVESLQEKPAFSLFPETFLTDLAQNQSRIAPIVLSPEEEARLEEKGYEVQQLPINQQFTQAFRTTLKMDHYIDKNLTTEPGTDREKLKKYLQTATGLLMMNLVLVDEVIRAVDRILQNQIPQEILAIVELEATLSGLDSSNENRLSQKKRVLTKNTALHTLQTLPLTSTINICPTSTSCTTHTFTFLPLIMEETRFHLNQILTLPVSASRSYGKKDWKKIKDAPKFLLQQPSKVIPIYTTLEESMECKTTPTSHPCDICTYLQINTVHDPCAVEISNEVTMFNYCQLEKTPEPKEQSIRLDNRRFGFTDPDSGTIVQTCQERKIVKVIPPSGVITFNPSCSYEMVDGPIQEKPFGVPIKFFDDIRKEQIPHLIHELSDLHEHFKNHGPIYIITTVSAVGFTIISIIIYCLVKWRRTRDRGMISARRAYGRVSIEEIEEPSNTIMLRNRPAPPIPIRRNPEFVISGATITGVV